MTETKSILIVDDHPTDAAIMKAAVERCLKPVDVNPIISLVHSPEDAIAWLNRETADLIISDLFMPPGKRPSQRFSQLALEVQCKEMDWPAGLELLSAPVTARSQKLVATAFWSYSGFGRYMDGIMGCAAGALPKDLFFIVASLLPEAEADDVLRFAPLRVLSVALQALLSADPRNQRQSLLLSLFGEASGWLRMYPHHAINIRRSVTTKLSGKQLPGLYQPKGQSKEDNEIADYMLAGAWMPSFAFVSQAARSKRSRAQTYYRIVMDAIEQERDWHIDMQLPSWMANASSGSQKISISSASVELPFRIPGPVQMPNVFRRAGQKLDHWHFADIIITLGFFSSWSHLEDQRIARSAQQIASIMYAGANRRYRGLEDLNKQAKAIAEDIEYMEYYLEKKILSAREAWGRFWKRDSPIAIIGSQQPRGGRGGHEYWLNGAFRIELPSTFNRTHDVG